MIKGSLSKRDFLKRLYKIAPYIKRLEIGLLEYFLPDARRDNKTRRDEKIL